VQKEIEGTAVMLVKNEEWAEGMASSLRAGLLAMQNAAPEHDGVIFMVCDQPYVTTGLLESLRETQAETGLPAAASSYAGKMGTPALFHRHLFSELLQLHGDTGARKLLAKHEGEVASVPFEEGSMDIDTPEDYARLLT
jgi:molybdenum cofactor cytidylyltransferase